MKKQVLLGSPSQPQLRSEDLPPTCDPLKLSNVSDLLKRGTESETHDRGARGKTRLHPPSRDPRPPQDEAVNGTPSEEQSSATRLLTPETTTVSWPHLVCRCGHRCGGTCAGVKCVWDRSWYAARKLSLHVPPPRCLGHVLWNWHTTQQTGCLTSRFPS